MHEIFNFFSQFVNCESSKDFLNPHVHVAPDKDGFSFLWPSPDLTKPYSLSHMEHVKLAQLEHHMYMCLYCIIMSKTASVQRIN